ncbi:MAG: hypothetical protein KJO77_03075 [Bacteroidia bacterium]|nr:hypothetical protein [Bacteroidia bacterium]NND52510.1 hypothetical protein [Flavobacteriaceae bacterium]
MKNLLYSAALAVLFTSCSVDSLQDENSNDLNVKSFETKVSCTETNLLNSKGEFKGTMTSYVDYDNNTVTLTLTAYKEKIRTSKLFFGPCGETSLTQLGMHTYTETFKENVYIANFEFKLDGIEADYCTRAVLNLSDDQGNETAFSDSTGFQTTKDGLYIQGFLKDCLNQ